MSGVGKVWEEVQRGNCPNEDYFTSHDSCEGCPYFNMDGRPLASVGVSAYTSKDEGGYLYCIVQFMKEYQR